MIQEIQPKQFHNEYKNVSIHATDVVLCFYGSSRRDDAIFMNERDNEICFPKVCELDSMYRQQLRYLFAIDDTQYFLLAIDNEELTKFKVSLSEYSFEPIRTLRKNTPQDSCFTGMTGYHLYSWYRETQFCGRCAHPLVHDEKERMMRCEQCGQMYFPKIAPAVIIGLRDGERIMMSRYAGREYKGRALLAGFCEIGETPEQTVVREVMEEVGLKAKNITYFDSQPWGFDSNLLLGYFADVDGDTKVTMDEKELASAQFVERTEISEVDAPMSLTETMIQAFRKGEA